MPNGDGWSILKQLLNTTQKMAYQNGFETLRVYGERVFGSSQAISGMVLDHVFDMVKNMEVKYSVDIF